jgi:tungstate transport system substrate-binding protein
MYYKNLSKRVLSLLALSLVLVLTVVLAGCSSAATTTKPAVTTSAAAPTTVATTVATTTTPAVTATTAAPTVAVTTTAPSPSPVKPAVPDMILATTTSTQDSGLLAVLMPLFEQQSGYKVKTIAVGSGAAMTMGEKGEADVLLVHAPASEVKFMDAGHGIDRKLVMHNDFIIIGPAADPAGIKNMTSAVDALKKIAASGTIFVSRGDNSGTDQLEKKLWTTSGITAKGQTWYQESGQGMGATLTIANEKAGYTITDRATYLATKAKLALDILVQGDPALLNIYHVILVNPTKSTLINAAGAKAFSDFMVAADTQKVIGEFGKDKYGAALFFPDAGKTDAQMGLK